MYLYNIFRRVYHIIYYFRWQNIWISHFQHVEFWVTSRIHIQCTVSWRHVAKSGRKQVFANQFQHWQFKSEPRSCLCSRFIFRKLWRTSRRKRYFPVMMFFLLVHSDRTSSRTESYIHWMVIQPLQEAGQRTCFLVFNKASDKAVQPVTVYSYITCRFTHSNITR